MEKREKLSQILSEKCDIDAFGSVLIFALRYCIGRHSYAPKLVIDFIVPLLSVLNDTTILCMERDVKEAASYDNPYLDGDYWYDFLDKIHADIDRRNQTVRENEIDMLVNLNDRS